MAWPTWLVDLWTSAKPYADKAAVWRGYEMDLTSLSILAVGVTVYTLLVFTFYQNLSLRAAFHSSWGKGRWWGKVIHGLESTFVFPVMSFLYFGVLALALFLLAPPSQSTYQIFLLSMAVISAVRLTAFISEGAAGDLAKLLPLSLLGVMIVNPSYATPEAIWARYREVFTLAPLLGRFFLLFLVLETGLRLARTTKDGIRTVAARRRARKHPGEAAPADESLTLEIQEGEARPPTPKAR